nr:lactadherin-like [Pocillopora verrucosa]
MPPSPQPRYHSSDVLHMAGRQASFFTALFFISLVFRDIASQQCHGIYSIYQMMLRGHTYKTFKTTPGTLECIEACLADDRCQSFNFMFLAICELNNRTKEARPEDFVKDENRYYMAKGLKRECGPVGVADRNAISDARITASTVYDTRFYPYYGRLHENRGYGGWCPRTVIDRTDYLQVDVGAMLSVCAVATQGEKINNEWTTNYKLQLSADGVTWNAYEETSTAKVFPGNSDRHSVVKHFLTTDIMARYVRFYPVTYHNFPCLRVEIYVRK